MKKKLLKKTGTMSLGGRKKASPEKPSGPRYLSQETRIVEDIDHGIHELHGFCLP